MIRTMLAAAAILSLSACDALKSMVAPANSEPAVDAAATDDVALAAWIDLNGSWAPKDACDDYLERWEIKAESFQLYEMQCPVKQIELIQDGVRVFSDCIAEGFDDGVKDVFRFERRPDSSLTIRHEANDAVTNGLYRCGSAAP